MKRILWLTFLALFAASMSMAQETPQKPEEKKAAEEKKAPDEKQAPEEKKAPEAAAEQPLPTLDQVLDKYVEAVGGKAALEKITSRQVKGVFDIAAMGASGTFTSWAKAPNKAATTIDVPGFGVIQQGFDGTVAWENNPMIGMRDLSGTELATRKRESTFHQELKMKELYDKIEVKGKQKIGEKDAYVLEATPAEGKVEKLYFDVQSGLLVRMDAERESPQGSALVETSFDNYKEVDGVKVPFALKQVMPQFTIELKFDEVKHNVEIEDTKFAKPAAQ